MTSLRVLRVSYFASPFLALALSACGASSSQPTGSTGASGSPGAGGAESGGGGTTAVGGAGGGSAGGVSGGGAGGAAAAGGGSGACSPTNTSDVPGSGSPCKTAFDCPQWHCECKDGSGDQAYAGCSLQNLQCSEQAVCAKSCCGAENIASQGPTRAYFLDAPECTAFCAKVKPLGCGKQGATDPCDPYDTCSAPVADCVDAVKALLTCETTTGVFSCGPSGWQVMHACPQLPANCQM